MKKKILSTLLAVCLFVGVAIPSVFAAYTSDLAGNAQKVTKITVLKPKYEIKEGEKVEFANEISVYETNSKLVIDLQQVRYTAVGDTNYFNINTDGVVTAVKTGGTITLTIYDDQNKSARVDTTITSIPGAGVNGNYATSFKFGDASRYDVVYDNVDTYHVDDDAAKDFRTVHSEGFEFTVESIPSGTMFNSQNEQEIIDRVKKEFNDKLGFTNILGNPIYGGADTSAKAKIEIDINALLGNGIVTGTIFQIGNVFVTGSATTQGNRLASLTAIKAALKGQDVTFGNTEKFNYNDAKSNDSKLVFDAKESRATTVTEQNVYNNVLNNSVKLNNSNAVELTTPGTADTTTPEVPAIANIFTVTLTASATAISADDIVTATIGGVAMTATAKLAASATATDIAAAIALANPTVTISNTLYNVTSNGAVLTFTADVTGAVTAVTGATFSNTGTAAAAPTGNLATTQVGADLTPAGTTPGTSSVITADLSSILARGIARGDQFFIGTSSVKGDTESAKSFADAKALVTTMDGTNTTIDGVTYTIDTDDLVRTNKVTLTATTGGVSADDVETKIASTIKNNGVAMGTTANVIVITNGTTGTVGYYQGVTAPAVTGDKTKITFKVAADEMQTPMGSMIFNRNVASEIKYLMIRQDGSTGLNVTAKTTMTAVKAIPVTKVGFITNDTIKVGQFKSYDVTYYPSNANVGKAKSVVFSTNRRSDLNNVEKYEHAVITNPETGKVTIRGIDASNDEGKSNAVTSLRATVTTGNGSVSTHDAVITVVPMDYTGGDAKTPYLNATTGAIKVGGQMVLSVKDTVAGTTVKWSIDNANVSIDPATGLATTIRGKKIGTSVVTATLSTGESYKATITVSAADVKPPVTPPVINEGGGASTNPPTGDTLFSNIG